MTLDTTRRVSFPALFSKLETPHAAHLVSGIRIRARQHPRAYLCYAGPPRSCEAKSYDRHNTHFKEMMACPSSEVQHKWSSSAWRNISGPRPILDTIWRETGGNVAEFRAGKGYNGDCAEIKLQNAAGIGAQVVFTLVCNVSTRSEPGKVGVQAEPGILCPKDNRVELSVVESGLALGSVIKGALVVLPMANMTNTTVHHLLPTSQKISVHPGSILVLVVDQSADLTSVRVCF